MARKVTKTAAPAKPVPNTKNDLIERFKDFPGINVLERRLDHPTDNGTLPLLLKDEPQDHCASTDHWVKHRELIVAGRKICRSCGLPFRKWYLRWVNLAEQNRWNTIKARGYVPVEIKELIDEDAIADLHKGERDTYVRRGERGLELLHKMPLAFFLELQHREEQARKKSQRTASIKGRVTEDAGRQLGSEAGDLVDGMRVFEDRTHRTTLGDEIDAMAE